MCIWFYHSTTKSFFGASFSDSYEAVYRVRNFLRPRLWLTFLGLPRKSFLVLPFMTRKSIKVFDRILFMGRLILSVVNVPTETSLSIVRYSQRNASLGEKFHDFEAVARKGPNKQTPKDGRHDGLRGVFRTTLCYRNNRKTFFWAPKVSKLKAISIGDIHSSVH